MDFLIDCDFTMQTAQALEQSGMLPEGAALELQKKEIDRALGGNDENPEA